MNKHFKEYFNSFKFNKLHLYTFLVDFATFWIIALFFFLYTSLIKTKTESLLQGGTIDNLQQFLLTAPVAQVQQFSVAMREYVFLFFGGLIVLIALTLLIISLSRALIWHKIKQKKLAKFWKWNSLHLAFLIPLIPYLLIFLIIKLIVMAFIKTSPMLSLIIGSLLNIIALLLFLYFAFFSYSHFTKHNQVFSAMGNAFKLFRKRYLKITKTLLFAIVTASIITVILYPIGLQLQYQPRILQIISMFFTFAFLSWLRLYTLNHA